MKLFDIFNRLLLEGKDNHEYGCVMLYPTDKITLLNDIQDTIPEDELYLGTDEDTGYGLETKPHVTILYGIHTDVKDNEVKTLIDDFNSINITIDEISMFENDKYDVIKFGISNESLSKYNKKLLTLPHTNDFPDYKPHITIGYLKPGFGKKYVRVLTDKEIINVEFNKVIYSKPDKTKITYNLEK